MLLKVIPAAEAPQVLSAMRERAAETNAEIAAAAEKILRDVRKNGFDAVKSYSERFDHAEPYEIPAERLRAAYDATPEALRKALEHAAENIRAYHMQRVPESWEWRKDEGRVLGQVLRGLDRVGIYVPGGTAAYPSSVLMLAIPARCAGVREIVMTTPPTENLSDAVLAAACIAGVDRVFAVGGVQAVAALAYGAGFIPRVDKIVGPGNAYVAAAKRLVYGSVDIDMVAGPSEVLVLADGSADPRYVAADLLGQAEHDRLASAILVTTSARLAEETAYELERQSVRLERRGIVVDSVTNYGAAIVCGTMEEAAAIANDVAPEHLEIMTENPRGVLPMIRNAGAVFLGAYTPEPLGDYLAGPSHVLPTSGSARFFSPIGVDSFIKRMSVIEYSKTALSEDADDITTVAYAEKLTAHAHAVEVRA
ncbi:MAG: histidinol dehydrogenase [Eubacteriales bacterium]|nr:histidinol dehydrogenase [Clostridiales bacterium]MDY3071867.1 histidinol dehydrogenase [Eubacteriales bacterium]MDY3287272.1 histidinol dehydrogenase [Eubacteriales bacterium]MDY5015798.1 histidinol dehydrogenase [Eubacteriales bacterium]